MTILYLDTNPFIDFIKQRTNEYGDDISNSAGQLFLDTLSCKYNIAVSGLCYCIIRLHGPQEETQTCPPLHIWKEDPKEGR